MEPRVVSYVRRALGAEVPPRPACSGIQFHSPPELAPPAPMRRWLALRVRVAPEGDFGDGEEELFDRGKRQYPD